MDTIRMGEDIFMRMYHWMEQNKVDGVWFNSVDDNYIKVTLIKKRFALSRAIRVNDFYTCYDYDYIEYLAKALNEEVDKLEEEK